MYNVQSPTNDDDNIEQQIKAAGATGPRVTPDQIEALIKRVTYKSYVPEGTTSTFVHAFLDDKFLLATGFSACVDASNFRAHIGINAASKGLEQKAKDKLWELEGYALYKQLNPPATTFQERVKAEQAELVDRLEKLVNFIEHTPLFKQLPTEDQLLLQEQRAYMTDYAEVLQKRVARFEGVSNV